MHPFNYVLGIAAQPVIWLINVYIFTYVILSEAPLSTLFHYVKTLGLFYFHY